LRLAETFTVDVEAGDDVVAVNVALACPAAIDTLAGTTTAALLLARSTAMPPAGAAPLMVTVPVTLPPPPMIAVGLSETETTAYGVIWTVWFSVVDPSVAEIVTGVVDETLDVAIVNEAEFAPAAIVTVAGTFAAEPLLANAMTDPPAGATPSMATVPVIPAEPPTTEDALTVKVVNTGGLTVRP
jgi:hypothetical protein